MQRCLAVHFDWLKVWKASAPEILTSPSLKCQLKNDNHSNYHTYVGFLIPKDVQAICTQFPKQTKIKRCSCFQLYISTVLLFTLRSFKIVDFAV